MLQISIKPEIEKSFITLVKTKFNGDFNLALEEFIELEEDLYLSPEDEEDRKQALKEFDRGETISLEQYANQRGIDV